MLKSKSAFQCVTEQTVATGWSRTSLPTEARAHASCEGSDAQSETMWKWLLHQAEEYSHQALSIWYWDGTVLLYGDANQYRTKLNTHAPRAEQHIEVHKLLSPEVSLPSLTSPTHSSEWNYSEGSHWPTQVWYYPCGVQMRDSKAMWQLWFWNATEMHPAHLPFSLRPGSVTLFR